MCSWHCANALQADIQGVVISGHATRLYSTTALPEGFVMKDRELRVTLSCSGVQMHRTEAPAGVLSGDAIWWPQDMRLQVGFVLRNQCVST